jgi:HK97 family phage portal protein
MSLLARLIDIRAQTVSSARDLYELLLARGGETDSGAVVTTETAMRHSSVYACIRVLSEDIAKLPLNLYQRLDRGRRRVTDHWLAALMEQPNPWQTGFEFREMQQAHLELAGRFYALKTIVRDEVRELLPIVPSRVKTIQSKDWRISYEVAMPDGTALPVPADHMLHVRGMTLDGIEGIGTIGYQRETIGLAIQTVKFGARMFKNGALLGGVLEHPHEMSEEAANRLRESFQEKYAGVDNAHKVILLEEGTKFNKTGMSAEDAQFLEARKLSRSEIAGIFRVPPHLIGDLDRATHSNIEQQARDYIQNGLLGRLQRIEARYRMSLIPAAMQGEFYFKHLVDYLQRGNYAERMSGYNTAINSGWMTRNEVRELEDMNPGPKELDEFLTPLNMDAPSRRDPEPSKTGD